MKKLIGRKRSQTQLERLLGCKEGQLLAVYGRRRIGKTFLIREFFRDKGVYFELTGASGSSMKDQLRRFPLAIQEAFMKDVPVPKDWAEALLLLKEVLDSIPKTKQVILFLDELPWLATPRSDLISSLEHTWNRYFSSRKNLLLVLCGSAASWMIKKVVNNTKGFYGRITQILHLFPFSLRETEEFLKEKQIFLDRKQIVELYMVTGGVAKYLDLLTPGQSAAENIQSLCFSSGGFLTTEFHRLFKSLFSHSERHLKIVEALAKTRQGLTISELAAKTNLSSGGTLSKTLEELEASGFIQYIFFFGRKKREGHYRLIDEYSLFYITWIKDNLVAMRKSLTRNHYSKLRLSPKFYSWAGYAFENLCIKHIESILEALKLSVVAEDISYWSQKGSQAKKGAQIDLIINRSDNCINLLEIKFSDSLYKIKKDYTQILNERRILFKEATGTHKSIFNTLLTPYGAQKNNNYLNAIDEQVDLNALFDY